MQDYEVLENLFDEEDLSKFTNELKLFAIEDSNEYINLYNENKLDSIYFNRLEKFILCLEKAYSKSMAVIPDNLYETLTEIYSEVTNKIIRGDMINQTKISHEYPELKGTIKKCHYITEREKELDVNRIKSHKSLEEWIKNSLDKLSSNNHTLELAPKFDGMSIILSIENGEIKSAITRGDKETGKGENKTNFVKAINDIPKLPYDKFGLKCEAIMSRSNFIKYNKYFGNNELVEPRTCVSGLLDTLSPSIEQLSYVTLVPLMVEPKGENVLPHSIPIKDISRQFEISKVSFNVDTLLEHMTMIISAIQDPDFDFNCDGIVVRFTDEEAIKVLGRDNEKCINEYERAWKFKPEVVKSKLIDVDQGIGVLGTVSFIAKVEPTEMKNKIIKSISIGSRDRLISMNLHKGDEVILVYDVVPYVYKDNTCKENLNEDVIKPITHCPICGTELVLNPELMCPNTNCPTRIQGKIYNYCVKMNIPNIGTSTIETLYNNNILTSIIDLYKLKLMKDKIISLDGFGKTKFENIIKSINSIKKANYATLFGSVGIQDVGVRMFQKIFKVLDWKQLLELVHKNNAVVELSQIPGIKEKTANKIIDGIRENIALLQALTTIIKEDKKSVKYKCVFTGFRNNEFKQFLENNWDTEVVDSVNKDVDLLIANSLDTESTKIKKARKLNIPIMTLNDAYTHFKYNPNINL